MVKSCRVAVRCHFPMIAVRYPACRAVPEHDLIASQRRRGSSTPFRAPCLPVSIARHGEQSACSQNVFRNSIPSRASRSMFGVVLTPRSIRPMAWPLIIAHTVNTMFGRRWLRSSPSPARRRDAKTTLTAKHHATDSRPQPCIGPRLLPAQWKRCAGSIYQMRGRRVHRSNTQRLQRPEDRRRCEHPQPDHPRPGRTGTRSTPPAEH